MVEREAEVIARVGGSLHLRPLGRACGGCDSGCGGRCRLFVADAEGQVVLPSDLCVSAGQHVRLSLDEAALRRAAWAGYGQAGVGLVAGAALGAALGQVPVLSPGADLLTLAGLLAGTLLAVRLSKRHVPATVIECMVRPAGD